MMQLAGADSSAKLQFPQKRAATYEEIHQYQDLGRFVVAPGSNFFLYEWSRPYEWAPDVDWLAPAAAKRMQTWIYKVDTNISSTTSEYLFHPSSACTYYLGSLAPNGKAVTFYEVNHDDNETKAGVVILDGSYPPRITRFKPAPDSARLELPPVWTSNEEFVYPTKTGLVTANINGEPMKRDENAPLVFGGDWDMPVKALPCKDCKPGMLEEHLAQEQKEQHSLVAAAKKKNTTKQSSPSSNSGDKVPENAKLVMHSADDELDIFAVDSPEYLSLYFTKNQRTHTLFENSRVMKPYQPPKAARSEDAKAQDHE